MVKAIDFFCGAGGVTRGLLDAGIEVLAGVDVDERLRKTYESNNAPSVFRNLDVETLDIASLRSELGIEQDDSVVYAACTPCQPFSTMNKMKGNDDRKHLLIAFARLVRASPPDFLLVENVPGLNTAYGREVYERFVAEIEQAGFRNRYAGFLDAKDFGVPQVRRRFIMLASRRGDVVAPEPAERTVSVRAAIGGYPALDDGESSATHCNHVSRKLVPHHKTIIKAIPRNGGSRSDVADTSILLKCHRERPDAHKAVFGRMAWDSPAPTLTSRCGDVYCGRFGHPDQDRGISLREAAALQSFPDDYEFFGSFQQVSRQIGNAVPVAFARRLGAAVLAALGAAPALDSTQGDGP